MKRPSADPENIPLCSQDDRSEGAERDRDADPAGGDREAWGVARFDEARGPGPDDDPRAVGRSGGLSCELEALKAGPSLAERNASGPCLAPAVVMVVGDLQVLAF
jgi:hypothetical protein